LLTCASSAQENLTEEWDSISQKLTRNFLQRFKPTKIREEAFFWFVTKK